MKESKVGFIRILNWRRWGLVDDGWDVGLIGVWLWVGVFRFLGR